MQSYLATAIGWSRVFMSENIENKGTTIKFKVIKINKSVKFCWF